MKGLKGFHVWMTKKEAALVRDLLAYHLDALNSEGQRNTLRIIRRIEMSERRFDKARRA